jgi:hypothetical protein
MILQFSRSVCCAAVVLLVIGASTTPGFEGVLRNTSPSCVHELVYEPFAGLILVSVTINGSPPLDFILDSGATQSAINDPYLANSLGLKAREAGLARGMGSGATRVLIADDTSIRSDGVEILRDQLVVHDISERLAALAGREGTVCCYTTPTRSTIVAQVNPCRSRWSTGGRLWRAQSESRRAAGRFSCGC